MNKNKKIKEALIWCLFVMCLLVIATFPALCVDIHYNNYYPKEKEVIKQLEKQVITFEEEDKGHYTVASYVEYGGTNEKVNFYWMTYFYTTEPLYHSEESFEMFVTEYELIYNKSEKMGIISYFGH